MKGRIAFGALGVLGLVAACTALLGAGLFPLQAALLVGCAVAVALPGAARRLAAPVTRLAAHARRAPRASALVHGGATFALFLAFALWKGQAFVPHWHDEWAYLLQARLLSEGHLWLAPHAEAQAFDSFHILVEPAYASKAFVGGALPWVLALWIHVAPGLLALLITGAAAGAGFLLVQRSAGSRAAVLTAPLAWASPVVWRSSAMILPQFTFVLEFAAATLLARAWFRKPKAWRAALVALALAAALLTRPAEAVLLLGPLGGAMLLRAWRAGARTLLTTAAAMLPCLCATLALQLCIDRGVTGRWLETPWQLYAEQYQPLELGPEHAAGFDLAQLTPQKQRFYENLIEPSVSRHSFANVLRSWTGTRLRGLLLALTPVLAGLGLLPFGWLARRCWRAYFAWCFAAMVLLQSLYAFAGAHYCLVAAPAGLALIGLGWGQVCRRFPAQRWRLQALVFWSALLAVPLGMSASPGGASPREEALGARLAALEPPCLVLIEFGRRAAEGTEFVYNIERAHIDDNPVIRAHLLPGRVVPLLRYYLERQPERHVVVLRRPSGESRSYASVAEALRVFEQDPEGGLPPLGAAPGK